MRTEISGNLSLGGMNTSEQFFISHFLFFVNSTNTPRLPELLLGAGLLRKADMLGERNIIPFESCINGTGPPGVKPVTRINSFTL